MCVYSLATIRCEKSREHGSVLQNVKYEGCSCCRWEDRQEIRDTRCSLKSRGGDTLLTVYSEVQCEGPLRLVACGCVHENAPEEPARKGRTVPGRGRQGHSPCEGTRGGAGGGASGRKAAWALSSRTATFYPTEGGTSLQSGENRCIRVMLLMAFPLQKRMFCPR